MYNGGLAELVGIHLGDGCISITKRYSEYYLGGDLYEEREYHDQWVGPLFNKHVMRPILGKDVIYKERPKMGLYAFHIFNKKVTDFFMSLGVASGKKINATIPSWILDEKEYLHRFLRGLFDTDGCLYFQKNYSCKVPKPTWPIIQLGLISKELIYEVFDILQWLGLHPQLKKPFIGKKGKHLAYVIKIYRNDDLAYFMKYIQFKNSKHITKWAIFQKYGYYLPYTTIKERKKLLKSL